MCLQNRTKNSKMESVERRIRMLGSEKLIQVRIQQKFTQTSDMCFLHSCIGTAVAHCAAIRAFELSTIVDPPVLTYKLYQLWRLL